MRSAVEVNNRVSRLVKGDCSLGSGDKPTTQANEKSEGLQGDMTIKGVRVALLTAGRDKPYALGLAAALVERGVAFDFIGSDDLDARELEETPLMKVWNLRGDQAADAPLMQKACRVLVYYGRLMNYAARTPAKLLHILWNNKFEFFDRTALILYYRLLGKKLVLTAHNVNAGKRDQSDNYLNRLSLRLQYRLVDHIFVHTEKMKVELTRAFGVTDDKVSVIPFGINNTLPKTGLAILEAKRRLSLDPEHRAILFFGNIAPYKGLEDLIAALGELVKERSDYRLIIAGKPKNSDLYWQGIRREIDVRGLRCMVIERSGYIPDEEVELYFKAADILTLPYREIFQSGVLFLGYSFGLPVVATDVGSLAEDVVEGHTGFVCRPQDPSDLARALRTYFDGPLYRDLEHWRVGIQAFANERYSWAKVGEITDGAYRKVLARL